MDRHKTLNDSLNDSCQKSKLTSWTKHVNQRGTVYTIRFDESTAILDPSDPDKSNHVQKITYKPKSQYHINRDLMKMTEFKSNTRFGSQADNHTFGDLSYISDICHSKPVSIVNTQESQADSTQDSLLCSNASHHAMPYDFTTHAISGVKLLQASLTQIHPPVEWESIDCIIPLVQSEASVSTHLHHDLNRVSCSLPLPIQPIAEQITVESENPEESIPESHSCWSTDSPHCDLLYDPTSDHDIDFGHTKSTLESESEVDFSISIDTDESPLAGLIEKLPSSKDILCYFCNTSVPNDSFMLYCDACKIYSCEHESCRITMLARSTNHPHSSHCKIRYMTVNESFLLYRDLDDYYSKDNSTLSDNSRPPGNCDSIKCEDQKVPVFFNK